MYNVSSLRGNHTQTNTKSQYTNTQMNTSERLKLVMEAKGINLKAFSECADIPYRTLQNYILSGREPNSEALIKLYTRLGINLNWLLSGEGNMFIDKINTLSLTESEKELLTNYQTCNSLTQRKINLAIAAIAQDEE